MALPTKVKTWQYANNLNPGLSGVDEIDLDNAFLLAKNAMLDFALSPWEVVGSSDSVAAGMDAVDRLVDHTDVVHSFGAHSWIVLQQPGISANTQICFDFFTTNTYQVFVHVSPTAGFTGGSTTARPTATDEMNIATPSPCETVQGYTSLGQGFECRVHVHQSTDGKCTRIFFMQASQVRSFIFVDVPLDPPTGWTNPVIAAAVSANQPSPILGVCSYNQWRNSALIKAQGPIAAMPMYMVFQGFATDGTSSGTYLGYRPFSNPDELRDGEFPISGIGIAHIGTVGQRGRHGHIADMWWTGETALNGNSFPADGSKQFIILGSMVFPWGGGDIELG